MSFRRRQLHHVLPSPSPWASLVLIKIFQFPKDLRYATIVGISSFHVHPGYNATGIREHDVAILKLSTDIAQDEWGTISYARLPQGLSDPQPGSDTTVVGWYVSPKETNKV